MHTIGPPDQRERGTVPRLPASIKLTKEGNDRDFRYTSLTAARGGGSEAGLNGEVSETAGIIPETQASAKHLPPCHSDRPPSYEDFIFTFSQTSRPG